MTIAMIGSNALRMYIPLVRKSKDYDIIGTYDDVVKYVERIMRGAFLGGEEPYSFYPINSGKKIIARRGTLIIEAEIAWPGSTAEKLLNIIKSDSKTYNDTNYYNCLIPSLDVLYMLKMSHRFLKDSPHFLKTMEDIWEMRCSNAKIREEHMEFFKEREKETYTYSHPKLNQDKKNFFSGDGIKYMFDHDSIHESMKLMERPAYTYFKPENSEVWCSKEMFFECDEEIRINAVLEESLVLALERSQIPFPKTKPINSFKKALEKVCTSITSGWFREYAWDHYDDVMLKFDKVRSDYVEKFWKDVESGIVIKLEEK